MRKYFGTDGVRGVANASLTPELAYKLGRAGGYLLSKDVTNPRFIVGRDTRLSGEMLESALIAGLMSVGIEVIRLGVISTPGVAYMTRTLNAEGGVMISASHNPFEDNGIKFFNNKGNKLSDEIELRIESIIDGEDTLPRPSGNKVGRISNYLEGIEKYTAFLKTTINGDFKGLKVVLDCANGAASPIATRLFKNLGAEVVTINDRPNGENINVNCGSTHPEELQRVVVSEKADIGFAYDGDADRLIAVDHKGEIVDGDEILFICAKGLMKKGQLKNNTVVSTVMSNFGFKKALDREEIKNVQTAVGDRYVLEEMMKNDYNLGGEQSGHIIFLQYNTTGDGLLSSIQLLNEVKNSKKTLNELKNEMKKYPQLLVNIKVEDKKLWETDFEVQQEIKAAEQRLEGNGRVLVRASGTENLVRVMAEGESEEIVNEIVNSIADAIRKIDSNRKIS